MKFSVSKIRDVSALKNLIWQIFTMLLLNTRFLRSSQWREGYFVPYRICNWFLNVRSLPPIYPVIHCCLLVPEIPTKKSLIWAYPMSKSSGWPGKVNDLLLIRTKLVQCMLRRKESRSCLQSILLLFLRLRGANSRKKEGRYVILV